MATNTLIYYTYLVESDAYEGNTIVVEGQENVSLIGYDGLGSVRQR